MRIQLIFYSLIFIGISTSCLGSSVKFFGDRTEIGGNDITILEDKDKSFSVLEAFHSNDYKVNTQKIPNLGVTNSAYWIKFEVENLSNNELILLQLAHANMDSVQFHIINNLDIIYSEGGGEGVAFNNRKYNHQNYIFDLEVPLKKTRVVLLRIESGEHIVVPLSLADVQETFEDSIISEVVFGVYAGIIMVMFFYNLFIYYSTKDRSYLYYVAYILFIGLTQATLIGYTFKYLWPDSTWLAKHAIYIFPSLAGIALAMFMRVFLKIEDYYPKLVWGIYICIGLYCLALLNSVIDNYNTTAKIIDVTAGLITLYALAISIIISIKGYRPAKFFLLAWTLFIIGIITFVLRNFGILPYSVFTNYTMHIGTAVEVVLISFALADRINALKKEKEGAQIRELKVVQENERILKEQNETLETKVKERTEELQIALRDRESAQTQLVHNEKMAAMGQLTAGVAHEINNPVNFITGNISALKKDIDDILAILKKYDEVAEESLSDKEKEAINNLKKELELDYLLEEMTFLIKGIDDGAERTSEIVKGLRTFSHLDEADFKKTDVKVGIDSTLVLLQSKVGEGIKINKNFNHKNEIEGYPGKLNQVYMNILNNAIDAIYQKEEGSGVGGAIDISTKEEGGHLIITIHDDGSGMSQETQRKVFEPFFTTKDVGKGTGLGMSITHGIIMDHHGSIEVESEEKKGTTFTIKLPMEQPKKELIPA